MSHLQEVEKLLPNLTKSEKAHLLQLVTSDIGDAFSGIESHIDICGGESCIAGTRIPIWVLEQARKLGASEAEILRSYPSLKAIDLVNAWTYISSHYNEVEQQIEENEVA